MNSPSLQRLTLLSIAFHLTFFLAAFMVIKQSSRLAMPSPYVVNLVGPDIRTEGKAETQAATQTEDRAQSPADAKENKTVAERTTHSKTVTKAEEKRVSDRIAALKAKENVERIAKLRNVISLKGSGEGKHASVRGTPGKSAGSPVNDYYSKITKDIWQNWDLPPAISDKNLETIISIRIWRDGSLQVERIEKSSGNSLFDRSALRAIAKASPVTPPPYEMEIGVRFYP